MAAMKAALPTIKRCLALIAPAPLLWLLLLCGTWAFSTPAASAQINFAFSVGDGVNAYYLPMASSFVYAYDGDLFLMVFEGGNTLVRGSLLAMLLQNGELTVLR